MFDSFYRKSKNAVRATKPEMMKHAEEIQDVINASGVQVELIAVNQYYKGSFIGLFSERLYVFCAFPIQGKVRNEYEFRDWDAAPNYVKLEDLKIGQMELF